MAGSKELALSEAHKKRRKRYLGASEVPAVLGVSPWKTASDVYYSKTAELESRDKVTHAINSGNLLEVAVLDFAQQEVGKIKRNQFRVSKERKWAAATLDALVVDQPGEGVEAKTTGNSAGWGEEGTDQIPLYYIAQVQWQMYVAQLHKVWVPCLMPDFALRFKLYVVERDEELIGSIVERCEDFWVNNVLACAPPPDSVPAPRTLQRMRRVPAKVAPVPDGLVKDWQDKKNLLKEARAAERDSRVKMLEQLGDAEVGTYSGGVINYFERERKAYTKRVSASNYRTLELKEGDEHGSPG